MLNKKGYIGAIGDDLPSLIPIFLGITIFFAVFLSTYNVYRNNTDLYSVKNDAINISGIIKEDPLFSDYNSFKRTCNKVDTKYNWSAFVTPLDLNSENYEVLKADKLDAEKLIKHWESPETGKEFYCGNKDLEELKTVLQTKDTIVYRYPVTVQQEFYVEPAWLYVVVWR